MSGPTVVVWDAVGNVFTGVRSWQEWNAVTQVALLREDPQAASHVVGLTELFKDHPIDIIRVSSLEELADHIGAAEFLLLHKVSVPGRVLASGKRLRLVEHLGSDYRGVPLDTARKMGVSVAAVPLLNYLAVAEHTWALVLHQLKQLTAIRRHMNEGKYVGTWGMFPGIALLQDLTLGVLGLGEIGRVVAEIGRSFHMQVNYWDIEEMPEIAERSGAQYRDWPSIFQQSDIVSVHLPLTEKTQQIIGGQEFQWMKPTALFVNTARGKLIQQPKLVESLMHSEIGAVALDVYEDEPLPLNDPILELHRRYPERVTLTPHCGWQSPWTWIRDSRAMWDNVLRALRGEGIHYLVS
jgi:phosphoglycerate dehydrogenase-like enzyme